MLLLIDIQKARRYLEKLKYVSVFEKYDYDDLSDGPLSESYCSSYSKLSLGI